MTETKTKAPGQQVAVLPTRLPYDPAIKDDFGIDRIGWKAIVETIFPAATNAGSVLMALAYCKSRGLDIFKRPVHIVPVYSKAANNGKGGMIDTVWPGISELRSTAFRTKQYAGKAPTVFGPDITENVGTVEMTYPEWAEVSVYRMVGENRVEFAGPRVYWKETYATQKRDDPTPNAMWKQRPRGQLDKCAEAAALRAAFPEEIGNDLIDDEMYGKTITPSGEEDAAAPPRPNFANHRKAEPAPEPEPAGEIAPTDDPKPEQKVVDYWPLVDHVGEEVGNFAGQEWFDAYREAIDRAASQGSGVIETLIENNEAARERFLDDFPLDAIEAEAIGQAFEVDEAAKNARSEAGPSPEADPGSQDTAAEPSGDQPASDGQENASEPFPDVVVPLPAEGNKSDRWTAWYQAMMARLKACATAAEYDAVMAANAETKAGAGQWSDFIDRNGAKIRTSLLQKANKAG